MLMGDEKETWKVKTLDEILLEKKRRRELEEKTDPKRQKNFTQSLVPQADDRESKRDTPEEGELQDQRMEITIRNSPYTREDSTEDRGEEDDSLAIKPPQQIARKDKSHHRKEEKRKDKRRHRSHSDEGVVKHVRPKDKEKERESERRKRLWEEDKARRDWERQKRREQARAHSRRERPRVESPGFFLDHRDRLEQQERQRERDRKLREQQKEQRELKERERRAEERRKERGGRREVPSHHRMLPDDYDDKTKQTHRSRSPTRLPQNRTEHSEQRTSATLKDEKPDGKDLLADLQDISDSERKTSSAESSIASGSGSEEEDDEDEEESSSQSEGAEEEGDEGESVTGSERSEQSAEDVSEDEQSEEDFEEERENGNHIPAVPESRFDHDSEESGEDMEDDDEEEDEDEAGDGDPTPQSQTHSRSPTPEENYIPDSPPISPVELKKELPKYLPALQGCRSVEEFQCLNRIEEGTYGVVYRAKDKKTDEIVALKRLKMEKEKEGFPITSLREINTILKAQHPNIVTVREIVVGSNMDKIYIVMNYVEHDLKSLMETMKQPFLPGEVKTLMIQLLRGVRHLHDNWILHRDLKTSNLLLSHKGILKIGDFGLAREYGSPLKPYTPVVVTLWYRSPDLLLGAKEYSTAVDMWSVGCIFGELLTQKPLFPGKSEIDQINKIFKDLGSPSEKIWPGYNELPAVKKMTFTEYPYNNLRKRFGALLSDQGFDLMNKFLTYCPSKRIVSDEALKHEYFRETPLPIEPSMFPTWPAKSEQQRVKRGTSPRPPEGGLGYAQLGDDDLKDTGFHLTTSNQGVSAVGPGFSLKF
ncbi:cyclin-dependent kinase 11B isoform X1 [Hippoglossus hippoglossus]|uniref:cyclin-dependent kinase 11B isoform X1 n=1 Tax=Hippoglossus hippoglossus TaxID=8267 RepID=UPI00148C01E0|nr:cyclin-dependent kinase 11B isoform X1 [Hippoglossus hippoglossus]XP_034446119.1 cyclin-dependent kinase 11B isoform X1 [Hippoglossus hippoglossus]XP_035014513.1 cyclin-dependent kinase 11B isoform X1 [Hippoglossus stenolepis]XP_035014514.1 cyclin-dependent kinase 11B isoform X1 [Hippoglossus stenolepis]XP_035014515.1 cyclin-dependent kinase 11B isoform X1 [Hippoglossus stenolepis]